MRLAEETLLTDEFLRQLINVGEVDILIGLPTHNNSRTIPPVLHAVQAGLLKCFPRERAVIVNADGGSQDDTPQLVTGVSIDDVWSASKVYTLRTLPVITTQYARVPDHGLALRTILAAADLLRARACVLISPDSTTIEPDWIQRLVHPIYAENTDLVSPLYRRHKFEGVLMRNLLYPLTRAVYGCQVREPFASEFAISGQLATDVLGRDRWNEEWGKVGPEIVLTITALTGKFRMAQSFLGDKAPVPRSSTDLVQAMRRTVGPLFASMDQDFAFWSVTPPASPSPPNGGASELTEESTRINRKQLRETFAHGVSQLEPVFRSILSSTTISEIQRIAALDLTEFRYPNETWARTIFEFAASFHKSVINRDHIIQALVPLYRGRALSFMLENRDSSTEEMEKNVESLCLEFEHLKPYLLEVWDGRK
jgi:glucosylglycerate synthase